LLLLTDKKGEGKKGPVSDRKRGGGGGGGSRVCLRTSCDKGGKRGGKGTVEVLGRHREKGGEQVVCRDEKRKGKRVDKTSFTTQRLGEKGPLLHLSFLRLVGEERRKKGGEGVGERQEYSCPVC